MHDSTRLIMDWRIHTNRHSEFCGEVPLHCQQELHTEGGLCVRTGKKTRRFKSGERGGHAVAPRLSIHRS
jgi:hypothetical protein